MKLRLYNSDPALTELHIFNDTYCVVIHLSKDLCTIIKNHRDIILEDESVINNCIQINTYLEHITTDKVRIYSSYKEDNINSFELNIESKNYLLIFDLKTFQFEFWRNDQLDLYDLTIANDRQIIENALNMIQEEWS